MDFPFYKVKSSDRFKHIPVIIVTTSNEKDKIIKAIQAGAKNYLIKPFTEQELIKKIMDSLNLTHEQICSSISGALRDIMYGITRSEVQESSGTQEEELEKELLCGQMLFLGQINAMVLLTMTKETATRVVSSINGSPPSELSREALLNGIAETTNKLAARSMSLMTESNVQLGLTTPFIFTGFAGEQRIILNKKAFVVSRKFQAGDIQLFLKTYFL